MPYSIFTKLIINHFLSQHKSLAKLKHLYINTIKDDGVLNKLKFVKMGEDFQEYGRAIPNTMLTDEIRQSKTYQTFLALCTSLIPPKKTIGQLVKEEHLCKQLKASKMVSKSQLHTGGSSEGDGVTPEVPDESIGIFTTLSEGTEEEKQDDQDDDDDRSIDIKETNNDERTEDAFVHGDEYVHDDVDEEIKDAEDDETGKDDEEITDAEKSEATKGDYEQVGNLPPTSFSLSVSSGFGNQFLNLSYDISIIGTTKESADTDMNSLLDIQIQQEVPHIQSPTLLNVPVLVIPEQATPTPSLALPTKTPVLTVPPPPPIVFAISSVQQQTTPIPTPPITTIAPSVTTTVLDPLPAIVQRVSELEKDVQELKQVDHSSAILATIRS
ncbi:hypothetical protein Tco_0657219 [Tanacetum coccineum]|uniref:Uncharacterized protein n=1 Tax=Tanacetum coccineum TaxID=301880 RepID=A0ABQ4XBM8_9ASTR